MKDESKLTPEEQAAKEYAESKHHNPNIAVPAFLSGIAWQKEQSYTREQVEELLRKQRHLCAAFAETEDQYRDGLDDYEIVKVINKNSILNAPSPLNDK